MQDVFFRACTRRLHESRRNGFPFSLHASIQDRQFSFCSSFSYSDDTENLIMFSIFQHFEGNKLPTTTNNTMPTILLGMGNPLLDISAEVPQEVLDKYELKVR